MNLPLGLCLCLLEVNQDREISPPEFPINKCRVPAAYQTCFLSKSNCCEILVSETINLILTSNGFFLPRRHSHLIPGAGHLPLPPKPQILYIITLTWTAKENRTQNTLEWLIYIYTKNASKSNMKMKLQIRICNWNWIMIWYQYKPYIK